MVEEFNHDENVSIEALSQGVLSTILSFLEKPKDVADCAVISKQFYIASDSDIIWKAMAKSIYGDELAYETLHKYDGNWKAMLIDDNRLGACPTLFNFKTSAWKHNGIATHLNNSSHYYCTIPCIKWDRKNKIIRVYIDARGEMDLRAPVRSGIRLRSNDGCSQKDTSGQRFVSELKEETAGHYKGFICYPEIIVDPSVHDVSNNTTGKCTFCYANLMQGSWADYEPVELFSFQPNTSMKDVFSNKNGKITYTSYKSPFVDETEEENRWRFLTPSLRKRKRPNVWWV